MSSSPLLDLRAAAQAHIPQLPRSAEVQRLYPAAIETWRGRMINEHGSAQVFEGLCQQLEQLDELRLTEAELKRVREFAAEERQHGVLCGAVVEALGGNAEAPPLDQESYPLHEDATRLEAVLRNLLSICCLSETVAVALIGAEREEMPDGELRELLTTIWADECGHANFGWRLLPRLLAAGAEDTTLASRLTEYLVVALAHLEQHELAHLPSRARPPAAGVALGLCSGREARALFYATVEGIILPGLDSHGLNASAAWKRRSEAGPVPLVLPKLSEA